MSDKVNMSQQQFENMTPEQQFENWWKDNSNGSSEDHARRSFIAGFMRARMADTSRDLESRLGPNSARCVICGGPHMHYRHFAPGGQS